MIRPTLFNLRVLFFLGGSTDTANLARRILGPEIRPAVISLFKTEGLEAPNLNILLMMLNVSARVVNSIRKVNVDKFEEFCTNTCLQLLHTFPFCNIAISIHRILMHCCQKMREMGNTGLGQLSENRYINNIWPLTISGFVVDEIFQRNSSNFATFLE